MPRTGALVASGDVDALVRALVFVAEALVDVLASLPIVSQVVPSSTDAPICVAFQLARVAAVSGGARIGRRQATSSVIRDHVGRASAFVGTL